MSKLFTGGVETSMSNFTKTDTGGDFALSIQASKSLAQPEEICRVMVFFGLLRKSRAGSPRYYSR